MTTPILTGLGYAVKPRGYLTREQAASIATPKHKAAAEAMVLPERHRVLGLGFTDADFESLKADFAKTGVRVRDTVMPFGPFRGLTLESIAALEEGDVVARFAWVSEGGELHVETLVFDGWDDLTAWRDGHAVLEVPVWLSKRNREMLGLTTDEVNDAIDAALARVEDLPDGRIPIAGRRAEFLDEEGQWAHMIDSDSRGVRYLDDLIAQEWKGGHMWPPTARPQGNTTWVYETTATRVALFLKRFCRHELTEVLSTRKHDVYLEVDRVPGKPYLCPEEGVMKLGRGKTMVVKRDGGWGFAGNRGDLACVMQAYGDGDEMRPSDFDPCGQMDEGPWRNHGPAAFLEVQSSAGRGLLADEVAVVKSRKRVYRRPDDDPTPEGWELDNGGALSREVSDRGSGPDRSGDDMDAAIRDQLAGGWESPEWHDQTVRASSDEWDDGRPTRPLEVPVRDAFGQVVRWLPPQVDRRYLSNHRTVRLLPVEHPLAYDRTCTPEKLGRTGTGRGPDCREQVCDQAWQRTLTLLARLDDVGGPRERLYREYKTRVAKAVRDEQDPPREWWDRLNDLKAESKRVLGVANETGHRWSVYLPAQCGKAIEQAVAAAKDRLTELMIEELGAEGAAEEFGKLAAAETAKTTVAELEAHAEALGFAGADLSAAEEKAHEEAVDTARADAAADAWVDSGADVDPEPVRTLVSQVNGTPHKLRSKKSALKLALHLEAELECEDWRTLTSEVTSTEAVVLAWHKRVPDLSRQYRVTKTGKTVALIAKEEVATA